MLLVVGATGVLGTEICSRLRALDCPVKALVRTGSPRAGALEALGVELVYGDLKNSASIETACRGVDRVITTANAMSSRRRGDSLKSVDRDGHLTLVRAAKDLARNGSQRSAMRMQPTKLTEAFIRRLVCEDKPIVVRDTTVTGLMITVHKHTKSYKVQRDLWVGERGRRRKAKTARHTLGTTQLQGRLAQCRISGN